MKSLKKSFKKYAAGDEDSKVPRPSPASTASAEPVPTCKPSSTSSRKIPSPKKPSRTASAHPAEKDQFKAHRGSRAFPRLATDPGSTSSTRRHKVDSATHPLNLHPDEYRRLSALSAPSNRSSFDSMDVDRQSSAATPLSSFSATKQPTNGESGIHNESATPVKEQASNEDSANEKGPAPPPHRSNPSSPVPTVLEEAEAHKAAGNKHFKDKQYGKAIIEYSQALQLIPDSATYLSNRAAAYMSNGSYEAALDDCLRAVDLDPNNGKFLLRLARIYTSLGQADEALITFARIQPPPSAKDMGSAKEMQHHINAAQGALNGGTSGSLVLHAVEQAEKLLGPGAPKPRKWQLMKGSAYLKMGGINSLGEAQNVAMALLRHNSQDPEALVLRGRALYGQGDIDTALTHFRKALSCDPDFRDAVKWLRIVQKLDRMKSEGNSDYKAGRWQAAFNKYTNALEVDPTNRGTNSKLLQNRALCHIKLKQYGEAIADCDRAINLDAQYIKARKTKATALGLAGQWGDAIQEWKSIQEMEPEDRTIAKEIRKAELEQKKSLRKDYYKILNVEKDADETAIKKAYRKLAIIHHPDKNQGDEQAAERFKDIGEAYETLSDPQKRARYDSGEDLIDPSDMYSGGGMAGGMNIDPEILFSMMNGGSDFGRGDGGAGFASGGGRPRGFPGGFQFG